MMKYFLSVLGLFNVAPPESNFSEDFDVASLTVSVKNVSLPVETKIREVLAQFPNRDILHCDVRADEGDTVSFHSSQPQLFAAFICTFQEILNVAGESPLIHFKISAEKQRVSEQLTVYSLPHFINHLEGLPLTLLLQRFSELIGSTTRIVFACLEGGQNFNTGSLWFAHEGNLENNNSLVANRDSIFSKRNDICHFENASAIRLIPEDFFLQKRALDERFNLIFDKLCILTSLLFIADITQLEDENGLQYKLNGYKAITGIIEWKEMGGGPVRDLFKIYQWVYEGGIINDKIGLARNLLSLHAKKGNLLDLDTDVLTSIRSGYQIYLKQNVKQYIEIKNKLIEFVTELSQKAAKLGEALGETLAKNFVAFASFFLSVIVVKAISEKDFTGSFTPKLAVIAYALLLASLIHWIVSLLMLNREISQMEKSYICIRKRYQDLLDPKDLENAFNNHDEYRIVIKNIKFKRCLYSCAWIAYLVIFTGVVVFLASADKKAPSSINVPVTNVPVTNAPVTNAPVTNAPVTNAPVTNAPVTNVPATNAPVTNAPVTNAPVTNAPVTNAPVTNTVLKL